MKEKGMEEERKETEKEEKLELKDKVLDKVSGGGCTDKNTAGGNEIFKTV